MPAPSSVLCVTISTVLYFLVLPPIMELFDTCTKTIDIQIDGSFLDRKYFNNHEPTNFDYPYGLKLLSRTMLPAAEARDSEMSCPLHGLPCVECRSDRHPFCRDPFNHSLIRLNNIPLTLCNGHCVKWILAPSEKDVCLRQSTSAGRTLCFCDRPKCNFSPLSRGVSMALLILLPFVSWTFDI